ncbi:spore germination protein [Bacillus timonensis]|nr:spore germination protein [Bacillus timonensis]
MKVRKRFSKIFGDSFIYPSEKNNQSISKITEYIHVSVDKNVEKVKGYLGYSTDLEHRVFHIGKSEKVKAVLFFMDGLADKNQVQDFILESLMLEGNGIHQNCLVDDVKNYLVTIGETKTVTGLGEVIKSILVGDCAIIIEGTQTAIITGTKGWKDRGVQEPSSQTVVRGPKDGFSETLRTNTALIRRKIKDPNLWCETLQIGTVTKTDVAIMYVNGIVNEKIVREVRARLQRIEIDGIFESGQIEELIEDSTYSPFPTIYNSERPDSIAGGLLEGRVAILVDGTPFALLVPALFIEFFQSSEDYYMRSDASTVLRFLRYFAFFLALIVPSSYVAVTTFHQEMLPTQLLISLASQREGVPFPAIVEVLLMEITFEILREAGVRMPRAVGSAISIVGALVLGQAAVEAGIVSSAMVIVVSLTAISSFVFPAFNMAISIRILRFGFVLLAANFGLMGIILGLIMMVIHLCSLRSFGIPYLSPMAPFYLADQEDAIFRFPQWGLFSRPSLINKENMIREKTTKPKPPNENSE